MAELLLSVLIGLSSLEGAASSCVYELFSFVETKTTENINIPEDTKQQKPGNIKESFKNAMKYSFQISFQ
jgi:hypothetical protein